MMLGIDGREGLGDGEPLDALHVAENAPLDRIAKAIFVGVAPDAFEQVRAVLGAEGFSVITGPSRSSGPAGERSRSPG
ncbi:hypothetical protein ACFU1Q_14805 [Brachybacterium paraconglomeratum]